jgi:asparagine synthase (glutamine-hydrolysing)
MALLFGCHDPAAAAETLSDWLAAAAPGALASQPQSAVVADGHLCAALGGAAHRGADGILAALVGFPRWRDPDLVRLAAAGGHAAALAEAWRRRGEHLWRDLAGSFALAVLDPAQGAVFLALDRIGQSHLFYAPYPGGLVFGSNADAVVRHPAVSDAIDPQAVYDYVYCHHCPSPGSIYRQVRKLEGGQYLLFRAGQERLERYWLPEFREDPGCPVETLEEQLRADIFGAVARLDDGAERRVGAFLSGGLDSSTVAGALARVRPEQAHTFTIGFAVEGYDEMAYARIAAEHFRTKAHEFYLSPDDAVAAIPMIAAAYDEPFGNSSALPTYFCARLAKDSGMDLLLGGDGGDELFGGNERYARQLLFEPYGALPGVLRGGLAAGLKSLPGSLAGRFPFSKALRYVEQAQVPLPDRLQDYNFLHRTAPAEVFAQDFLASVDPGAPLAAQRECYRRVGDASALNRMLYLDWKITLHDNDLVKVNKMCELAGMPVAYPMLDDEVVALSCRVPSAAKVRRGQLRWFYKKAMADVLPEAILKKSKHGFGLPFGLWLKDHPPLRDLAYTNVRRLKDRPYFRPDFLDQAIALHQSGHAAYYGELIWILMMLELWFAAKADLSKSPR